MNFTDSRLSLAVLLLSFALLIGAGVVLAEDLPVPTDGPAQVALPDSIDNGGYYLSVTVDTDFATTIENVRAALTDEGFGVLTEIDLEAKLEEKLRTQIPPYMILGACHPPLAHAVYVDEGWIGAMMPCNFVIREMGDGTVAVGAENPLMLPVATGNPELELAARELTAAVGRVLAAL